MKVSFVDAQPTIGTGEQPVTPTTEVPKTPDNGTTPSSSNQVETLGKEVTVYRGAKDQTINVTQPNGITGGVSMSLDKNVACYLVYLN
jgi:hypothetical protein